MPAEHDRAVHPSTMKVKVALREIDPYNANLFHGSLHSGGRTTAPPWYIQMPSGGGVHSLIFALPRTFLCRR